MTASIRVFVVNRFDDASVYKFWWNTTLIADPVPASGRFLGRRAHGAGVG